MKICQENVSPEYRRLLSLSAGWVTPVRRDERERSVVTSEYVNRFKARTQVGHGQLMIFVFLLTSCMRPSVFDTE